MMSVKAVGRDAHDRVMNDVLRSLRVSLAKLDRINAPPDIGAHIDCAICRIEQVNGK
jgi:hypothetical protein